jgi:catalase
MRRRNVVKERQRKLTTNQGVPVTNSQNSLTPESAEMLAG